MSTSSSTSFYGVYLPYMLDETDRSVDADDRVFTDKIEALKFAKKYKEARFKCFSEKSDALNFSLGCINSSIIQSPLGSGQISDSVTHNSTTKSPSGETLPFRAPKTQELSKLRKAIEANNKDLVTQLIWENPRYLISSGDTPTLLQEGFRYNAFHVSSKSNKHDILSLLLETLEDPEFYKLLYEHDSEEARERRMDFLVDLYLNMPDRPDKGNGDAPLHFACKFGHVEVVRFLTSHPNTNKEKPNKYGETPMDVIGSRVTCSQADKDTIKALLEEHYYVPLYRSDDNTTSAVIGVPWSPDNKTNLSQSSSSPMCSATKEVKACAGPMSPRRSQEFYKRWSSPSYSSEVKRKVFKIRCGDTSKGFERIGRTLAHDMNVPWVEYWSFLDTHVDLSSEAGLEKLESHLHQMCQQLSDSDFVDDESIQCENCSVNVSFLQDGALSNTENQSKNCADNPNLSIYSDGVVSSLTADFECLNINDSSCIEEGDPETSELLQSLTDLDKSKAEFAAPFNGSGDEEHSIDNSMSLSKILQTSYSRLVPGIFNVFGKMFSITKYVGNFIFGKRQALQKIDKGEPENHEEIQPTTKKLTEALSCLSNKIFFINGSQPSKLDRDVYRAIDIHQLSAAKCPHITRWRQLIGSFPDQAREGWTSPSLSRKPFKKKKDVDSYDSSLSPVWHIKNISTSSPVPQGNVNSPAQKTNLSDLQKRLFLGIGDH